MRWEQGKSEPLETGGGAQNIRVIVIVAGIGVAEGLFKE
jgi:hypothetical protein